MRYRVGARLSSRPAGLPDLLHPITHPVKQSTGTHRNGSRVDLRSRKPEAVESRLTPAGARGVVAQGNRQRPDPIRRAPGHAGTGASLRGQPYASTRSPGDACGNGAARRDAQPGAIVRKVTATEVREICQVRSRPGVRGGPPGLRTDRGAMQLERLRSDLRQLTEVESTDRRRFIAEARAVDSRLHDLIAGRCGNSFLAHELGRLKDLFRAFRDAAWDHSESQQRLPPPGGGIQRAPGDRRGAAGRKPAGRCPRNGRPHRVRNDLLVSRTSGGSDVPSIARMLRIVSRKSADEPFDLLPDRLRKRILVQPGRVGHECRPDASLCPCCASGRNGCRRGQARNTTATSGRSWRRTASPATARIARRGRPTCGSTAARPPSRPAPSRRAISRRAS